jgi:RNA polymerase sigma-70 factor (ECF subfamily)
MTSDWEYLLKAKKGDDRSAEHIFNKYYKSLLRMTALITGSLDSAKDVVQETFIRLIKKRIKHQDGSFKTYITTIAYRLALKEKYRKSKNTHFLSHVLGDRQISPYEQQIEIETQEHVFKAIQSLQKEKKEILVLKFYGKHSYEEISDITGIPIGTVKSRLFYAVKECGKKLKKQGMIE